MKEWTCTVCGLIHQDQSPPEHCPRCGADAWRFIQNQAPRPELEQKIKEAYTAESKAFVRNLAFSHKAERDGFPQVARLFAAVAEAERVHANEYLKYMTGVVGDTEDNLKTAFENEIMAHTEGYAPMIKAAMDAKREDVVWSFNRARDVEAHHAKLYKNALSAMAADRDVTYHVCQVCGFVFDDQLPDQCPVCRADREHFKPID
jgi:rubrerythrin